MREITEKTTISIAIVVTLIGCSAWMSKIYFVAEAAATKVEQVSLKQDKYSDDLADIKKDIAVIKSIVQKEVK